MKVSFFVHNHMGGGGISPVVEYASQSLASCTDWDVSVVFIHEQIDKLSGTCPKVKHFALDLKTKGYGCFLSWIKEYKPDVIITNHIGEVDHLFPFLPQDVRHIAVLHHGGRRYLRHTVAQCKSLDGIFAVANHLETKIRPALVKSGFRGVLDTVHNGASFPAYSRKPCRGDKIRLLFMSGDDPFKGLTDLFPILVGLKRLSVSFSLVIAGGIDPNLMKRFAQAGFGNSVSWAGRVTHRECYRLASEADIFLMLSRKEPFGMVTIEAMSMGAVPIAYDTESGNREIIQHRLNGILVKLGDIKSLVSYIQLLHYDRSLLKALSEKASSHARSYFGADQFGQRLVAAIDQVINLPADRRSHRVKGTPPSTRNVSQPIISTYSKLSLNTRKFIRRWIGSHPKLCYFLLNNIY